MTRPSTPRDTDMPTGPCDPTGPAATEPRSTPGPAVPEPATTGSPGLGPTRTDATGVGPSATGPSAASEPPVEGPHAHPGRLQRLRRVLAPVGLGAAGYGALVLLGVIAHEARLAGWLSLLFGLGLLASGLPHLSLRRRGLVTALGAVCLGGTVVYNVATGSTMSLPEWGIIGYGAALLAAAPRLDARIGPGRRFDVGSMVAWSFPLLLAPLAMFALNAALSRDASELAAAPLVNALVVLPTAWALTAIGTPVELVGNNMILSTPRGGLVLGVGLVCAGLYPMVLFSGLVALHGWHRRLPPRRIAAYLGAGLAGLWLLNVVRLVILTKVGQAWGAEMLQTTHAHLGWILFGLFTVVFWGIVLRKVEAKPPIAHV